MLFSNTFSNSLKNLALNIIKVLICFTIYFNSITLANAAVGGWDLRNPIAQGASTLYDATKNVMINGKNVVKKSSALITPNATQVAKLLGKGVAGLALSVAVEQLLGSVDWVLDPANNQIVYYPPASDATSPQYQFYWSTSSKKDDGSSAIGKTPVEACQNLLRGRTALKNETANATAITNSGNKYCFYGQNSQLGSLSKVANPAYDPTAENDDKKTLPLDVVAQKVISNAEGGDAAAQEATKAAAADIVAEAETDSTKARPITKQLEANAETATDETASGGAVPKDPTAPNAPPATDISLEFPVFCNWAPLVCEAAQVAISFPTLVTDWWESANSKANGWASSISEAWTAVKDWVKEEPKQQEKTEVEIEDIPKPVKGVTVSIGDNVCPTMPVNIHTPFNTIQTDISPIYLCQIATGMKAFFIALGLFTASLIVGRRN